jgi:hypothetical protein
MALRATRSLKIRATRQIIGFHGNSHNQWSSNRRSAEGHTAPLGYQGQLVIAANLCSHAKPHSAWAMGIWPARCRRQAPIVMRLMVRPLTIKGRETRWWSC